MSRIYGTSVIYPTCRFGTEGYTQCSGCKKWYTHLGISRHWAKCKDPGMIKRQAEIRRRTFTIMKGSLR